MKLRVIGDVHGMYELYVELVNGSDGRSVQLGDFGFRFDALEGLDPDRHHIIGGNHDNYDILDTGKVPHYLGPYGVWYVPEWEREEFFFVSGAYSVDKMLRCQGVDWWPQEELSMRQCHDALELYKRTRPLVMLSHDCPEIVLRERKIDLGLGKLITTRTGQLLDAMFEIFEPVLWVFAHHHQTRHFQIGKTRFTCVDEMAYIDI